MTQYMRKEDRPEGMYVYNTGGINWCWYYWVKGGVVIHSERFHKSEYDHPDFDCYASVSRRSGCSEGWWKELCGHLEENPKDIKEIIRPIDPLSYDLAFVAE